jgi:hypothetical protein
MRQQTATMTRKNIVLIAVVVLLGGIYVFFFSDWFTKEEIQIAHTIREEQITRRPRAGRPPVAEKVYTVSFGLNGKFALTSVKVIPVSELATNKYAHPVWHLVSDSNSVPTKALIYGRPIQGMRPSVERARADPLEPNVKYRLMIEAGPRKGQHDFQTAARR